MGVPWLQAQYEMCLFNHIGYVYFRVLWSLLVVWRWDIHWMSALLRFCNWPGLISHCVQRVQVWPGATRWAPWCSVTRLHMTSWLLVTLYLQQERLFHSSVTIFNCFLTKNQFLCVGEQIQNVQNLVFVCFIITEAQQVPLCRWTPNSKLSWKKNVKKEC